MGTLDIWGYMPPIVIRPAPENASVKKASVETSRVLQGIGENPLALNTLTMEQSKLRPVFKGFDPEDISPDELGKVGEKLFAYGLIDNLTADLMSRAALEFDSKGKISNPDVKINSLEFFAERIDSMQKKIISGDKYAKLLLPDYIKAVHVMKNLQVFVNTGDGYRTVQTDKLVKEGKIPKVVPMLKSKV